MSTFNEVSLFKILPSSHISVQLSSFPASTNVRERCNSLLLWAGKRAGREGHIQRWTDTVTCNLSMCLVMFYGYLARNSLFQMLGPSAALYLFCAGNVFYKFGRHCCYKTWGVPNLFHLSVLMLYLELWNSVCASKTTLCCHGFMSSFC